MVEVATVPSLDQLQAQARWGILIDAKRSGSKNERINCRSMDLHVSFAA